MNFPTMDSRNKDDILNELKQLAQFYIPEWNKDYNKDDIGLALMNVFADMFSDTITRFNKMPYKSYIYFLNLMGAEVRPASPAEGYLTVKVNSGGGHGAFIKKGTRAYGIDSTGEKVIFELQNDLYAVESSITDIFFKYGKGIIMHNGMDNGISRTIRLFDFLGGKNLQVRSIAVSSDYILNVNPRTDISITVINSERPFMEDKAAEILADSRLTKWQAFDGDSWKDAPVIGRTSNKINICIGQAVPVSEFEGIAGRWLKCLVNTDYDIFFTDLLLSARAEGLSPDCIYNNDLHLTVSDFLPFGESFARFDCFYIGAAEVFTKKSANITVEFSVSFIETPIDSTVEIKKWKPVFEASELGGNKPSFIYIDEVVWEYWNGCGWMRLLDTPSYDSVFKRGARETICFKCPTDLERCIVGGSENYFIRAKILKHGDFWLNSKYKYPVIDCVKLSYRCEGGGVSADRIFIEKDMEINEISDRSLEICANSKHEKLPAAYLALDMPVQTKIFSVYFHMAGYWEINKSNRNFYNNYETAKAPEIKFEYYGNHNGSIGWMPLKAIDETKSFTVSGIITFICNGNFEKLCMFSTEKYWIRAVNTGGEYANPNWARLPQLKGIYFNTVKISQAETMPPEYFSIEYGEANKKYKLSCSNVVGVKVFVNESRKQKNSFESIDENWVEWECTKSLNACKPNDKVYILNAVEGTVTFGNGKKGEIPTCGEDTIRIEYSSCSGSEGNMDAYKINGFADSVPFIEKIFNAEPVLGGCNKESIEEAIVRNALRTGCQNRIVTAHDCGIIAASADRNIVKVKTIISNEGSTIITVLPKNINGAENYFLNIKERIIREIEQKAPLILIGKDKIQVIEAVYILFSVHISIISENFYDYRQTHNELEKELADFFNPVSGNSGKGFEIGILPTKTQIINYLKRTGINIDKIHISCAEKSRSGVKEIDYEKAMSIPYAVPLSGNHEIELLLR